jgi:hypothetical protein
MSDEHNDTFRPEAIKNGGFDNVASGYRMTHANKGRGDR